MTALLSHTTLPMVVVNCCCDVQAVIIPVHIHDYVNKIHRARSQLIKQGIHQPGFHELGNKVGLEASRVQEYLHAAIQTKSLEAPAYAISTGKAEPSDLTLQDTLTTDSQHEEEEEEEDGKRDVQHQDDGARINLNALLMTLLPRERNVLRMRYGLHDAKGTCMTFTDIGAAYGLSKERVRQIEDQALVKLRHPGRVRLLQRSSV